MKEISPGLWLGDELDEQDLARAKYQRDGKQFVVVHACKEPYHRAALGYTSRAAPKDHEEYLIAHRSGRLILNLVDAADPKYIPMEIFEAAIQFIHEQLAAGRQVLVHCNKGHSRSPAIALAYLLAAKDIFKSYSFEDGMKVLEGRYPGADLAGGVSGFLRDNWENFQNMRLPAAT